jgi:hypothetical protein
MRKSAMKTHSRLTQMLEGFLAVGTLDHVVGLMHGEFVIAQ